MKTAISIPDGLYNKVAEAAERMGIPRSQYFARAVEEYLERHQEESVTERINSLLQVETSHIDSAIQAMQASTILEQTENDTW